MQPLSLLGFCMKSVNKIALLVGGRSVASMMSGRGDGSVRSGSVFSQISNSIRQHRSGEQLRYGTFVKMDSMAVSRRCRTELMMSCLFGSGGGGVKKQSFSPEMPL